MATPVFGFSVGDFISAINLINKVRKSLKDAGGAANEYQSAVIELENLATTLSHLEALQPDEDNAQHVNAIRAMAMACKFPLEEFRRKMARYESSLGPLARRKSLHTFGQKTKWSVTFAEDVEKLRALVAAKHISINLLLGMQTSKTLSKLSTEMRSSVQRLEEKIAEHHTKFSSVQECTQNMYDRIQSGQVTDHQILESIYARVDRTNHSVVQARHFGQQIMDYLNTFSGKIQGLLRAILQSNLQTYQLMLQMQQTISPRPTNLLESNIRFEDALGEIKELPYEYFRHWEPFEGFLRAHFRHKPGESNIANSHYYIIDSANREAIIKKDHWTRYIREGATISMSMIMSYIKMQSGICPRPGCSGAGSRMEGTSNTLYCKTCSLEFFQLEHNLSDSFGRISVLPEDEEVTKKQIAEDISLYGSRPHPPDAVTINEHIQPSNLPPKRGATEFDEAVNRPAKVRRKTESKELDHQRVTAMDWNSGATPLDAWLNQSAVPSVAPVPQTQKNQSCSSSDDLAAKELEDLKVFRTIHIEEFEEPKSIERPGSSAIDLTILEPRAQIYLRNILDRYPRLPSYLALRLAKANCARANRLDRIRHNRGDQPASKPIHVSGHDRPPSSNRRSSMDDVVQNPKPLGSTQDGIDLDDPYDCLGPNPWSPYQFRYNVTLDAPTAMIRKADEIPVSYLNKGEAYTVTIRDCERGFLPIGFSQYRTVFRISFEDEQQRQNPSACWQLWKEGRGVSEAFSRGGKIQAIEYIGLNYNRHMEIWKPCIKLETSSFDSFSVSWSPVPETSTVSCSILIRFHFLSTDFSHVKGVKGVPVRLYAKTEILSNTLVPLLGSTAELCFCKIKLFRQGFAERKLSNDVSHIKKTLNKLEQQIAQMQNDNKDFGSASKGVNHQAGKVLVYNHSWSASSQGSNGRATAERDLHTKLAKMRHMSSSTRPTSVLNMKGGERDDPDEYPVYLPTESPFRQQPSSRTTCMLCSESDHQLEDCPFRKRELSSSHTNAGFWSVRGSRSRAVSVNSQSSERNSSLHGSGGLDPEDQELSFPDDRSRRSSASFSESSAAFPPPPVYIHRERYPPTDGDKEVMDQAPEPTCPICDICGQRTEVLRRRDWQTHVLRDLTPYVCTVEDCDEPTKQFNSRRSYVLHEIRWHELGHEVFDPKLAERKLKESVTGGCIFCGEQTGGENNNREKHIGRHMEEIAFAVVRKPYEEWDFYSDSSGQAQHELESDPLPDL